MSLKDDRHLTQVERRHLLYIVILALVVRVFVSVATPVIGTDCYNYVHAARCFVEGQYSEALRQGFHPLFPFFIAWAYLVVGDYEVAGKAVSLSFGVFTIFPLYFFTRSMFGHRAAIFAAGFLALNPAHVRLSADIMSDPVHIFFFTTAVWLTWVALERRVWYLNALVGAVVCLDYYTRTEGIGLFLVILPWFILANLKYTREDILKRVFHIAIFTSALLVLAAPYLIYIKKDTGHWYYTQHKAVKIIEGKHEVKRPDLEGTQFRRGTWERRTPEAVLLARWKETGQYHRIFIHILNEFAKDFYPPLLLFFFVGFFKIAIPRFEIISLSGLTKLLPSCLAFLRLRLESFDHRKELFIISLFCLYSVPLYLIAYKSYFISGRYLLPMVVLSFTWAGHGFQRVSDRIIGSFVWMAQPALYSSRGMLILMALVLAVTLPKTLKIKRKYEVSKKEAGYWIKEHFSSRPVIMGDEKVAFYARGVYEPLDSVNCERIMERAESLRIDYLVFYREDVPAGFPEIYDKVEGSECFSFLKEWADKVGVKEKHLRLYKFVCK